MKRGDIVVVPFPFEDRLGSKVRPALVVQSDVENGRLNNTIVAMITGNLKEQSQPSNLLLDPSAPFAANSGLHGPSLVKCSNLATIRQHLVIQLLGRLSAPALLRVDECLKSALGVV